MTYTVADIIYYIAALGLIIGLMYGMSYLIRRFMPGAVPLPKALKNRKKSSKNRLEYIESLALHTEDRVFLVRCDDKEYLIYRNAKNSTLLDSFTPLDGTNKKNNNKRKTSK